jgi:hypothetical protein
MPRGRPRKIQSARREVTRVLKWAEQQGFHNIADALRRALALMPDDEPKPQAVIFVTSTGAVHQQLSKGYVVRVRVTLPFRVVTVVLGFLPAPDVRVIVVFPLFVRVVARVPLFVARNV